MQNLIKRLFRRGELHCEDVRKLSSDYLDEQLPQVKHSAIYTHLSKCGPCRAFIDGLASTIGVLSRLPQMMTPPDLKRSILEQTAGERDQRMP